MAQEAFEVRYRLSSRFVGPGLFEGMCVKPTLNDGTIYLYFPIQLSMESALHILATFLQLHLLPFCVFFLFS